MYSPNVRDVVRCESPGMWYHGCLAVVAGHNCLSLAGTRGTLVWIDVTAVVVMPSELVRVK